MRSMHDTLIWLVSFEWDETCGFNVDNLRLSVICLNNWLAFFNLSPDPNTGFSTIISTGWYSWTVLLVLWILDVVTSWCVLSSLRSEEGVEVACAPIPSEKDWLGVSCAVPSCKPSSVNMGFATNFFNLDSRLGANKELIPPEIACCSLNQLCKK